MADDPEELPDATDLTRQDSATSWGAADFGDDEDAGWGDDDEKGGGTDIEDDWGDMDAQEEATQLMDQIPGDIKERVKRDLKELAVISKFTSAEPNFGGGTRITVTMGFPAAILPLDSEQARAWALDMNSLVVVKLSLPPHYFNITQHSQIKVEVGQAKRIDEEAKGGFGLSWTIENKIKTKFFPELPNNLVQPDYKLEDVEEVMDISGVDFSLALHALRENKHEVSSAVSSLCSTSRPKLVRHVSDAQEKAAKASKKPLKSFPKSVQKLVEIHGVEPEVAQLAIDTSSGLDEAALLLTDQAAVARLRTIAEEDEKMGPPQQLSLRRSLSDPNERLLISLLEGHNFLVRLMVFVEEALQSCHKYCVVCGRPLVFVGLKPSICDNVLCKMGFEEFGLGFDLTSLILEEGHVVDLLITLCYASALSSRLHFVTPINVSAPSDDPKVELHFIKDEQREYFLEEQKNNPDMKPGEFQELCHKCLDTNRVMDVLNSCPSVDEMQQMARRGKLEAELNAINRLLFPLLRWIMTSNRAHLRLMNPSEQMEDFKTPHQFILLSSPPEKEARFQQLKSAAALKKKGVGAVYAFHGSSTANWHSILRTGLKNMSGTKYMSTGQAYGPGIYMALQSGTSLGYSRNSAGWSKSRFGPNIKLLALCEVINHPDLKPPNPYYVVPQEDWVTTRYVMVYPSGSSVNINLKNSSVTNKLPDINVGLPKSGASSSSSSS